MVAALSVVVLLFVVFSDRYLPTVADWYTRMVIYYVPERALRRVPGMSADDRLFYLCARSVARELEDERSVVTFSESAMELEALGGDRYVLISYVDVVGDQGAFQRRLFTCIAHNDAGEWRIEEVAVT